MLRTFLRKTDGLLKFLCLNHRNVLPNDLINEYFLQEHFSLSQFVELTMCKEKELYNIVHTRSDPSILRIPSYRSISNSGSVPKIEISYSGNLLIEHLCSLKNEASVRNVMELWAEDDLSVLLMLMERVVDGGTLEDVNMI